MVKPEKIFPTAAEKNSTAGNEVLFTSKRSQWEWIKEHGMGDVLLAISEAFGKPDRVTFYLQPQDRSKS